MSQIKEGKQQQMNLTVDSSVLEQLFSENRKRIYKTLPKEINNNSNISKSNNNNNNNNNINSNNN